MSRDKKIRLALVGKGRWGSVYIKTIKLIPEIVLSEEFILGKDYKKVLTKGNVKVLDGVIIASPTSTHFEVASFLLKNGFDNLLIEKPLTNNLETAQELFQLQKNYPGSSLLVGHLLLYDQGYKKMKKVASKKIGKITQINYTSLKSSPILGSTVIQESGPHPFYLFLDISVSSPKKVLAKSTNYDNILLAVNFENNISATALIGSIYPKRIRELEIVGEKGKLVLNEFINPRELVFIDKNNKRESISFPQDKNPLEMQLREFLNCIKTGRRPQTPISQGIEVVRLIEQAEASLVNG